MEKKNNTCSQGPRNRVQLTSHCYLLKLMQLGIFMGIQIKIWN